MLERGEGEGEGDGADAEAARSTGATTDKRRRGARRRATSGERGSPRLRRAAAGLFVAGARRRFVVFVCFDLDRNGDENG